MSFIAAGGAIVGAGVSIYSGIQQRKAAQKQLSNNSFVPASVPQAARDNQEIARAQANEGLPSAQYDLAMKNIQRSRTAAIRDANDRRGGLGLIGQIQQNADDSTARLDANNSQARVNNTNKLIQVNNQVAGYQQGAYDRNSREQERQYEYGMSLLGAGNANILGGIDTGVAGLMRYGSYRSNYASNNSASPVGRFSSPGDTSIYQSASPNVTGGSLNPLLLN